MTITIVLWAGGLMMVALFALVGILYSSIIKRLDGFDIIARRQNGHAPEVLASRISTSERFITELREMKHLKVDPYIPAVIDDLHRRVRKLEEKP